MNEDFKNSNALTITKESAEIAAKTFLSAIPIGGTLISCVWDSIKANCAQKRLQEWQSLIERRLATVETSLEDIGNNELFTTAMFAATELAIKTAEQEKRKFLADAVLNCAKSSLDESIVMMFFDFVGKYTLWHLKVLDFFENPCKFSGISANNYVMGSPAQVLFTVYPELRSNEPFVDKIVKELYNDGLMSTENLRCTMTGGGMVASKTTALGNRFIRFITA